MMTIVRFKDLLVLVVQSSLWTTHNVLKGIVAGSFPSGKAPRQGDYR